MSHSKEKVASQNWAVKILLVTLYIWYSFRNAPWQAGLIQGACAKPVLGAAHGLNIPSHNYNLL